VLRDEGEAYAGRMRAAGVPVTLRRFSGQMHGFLSRFAVQPSARAAMTRLNQAIAGHPSDGAPGTAPLRPVHRMATISERELG
jgi:acetyl esterase/lipase